MYIMHELIREARRADLYQYLCTNHPECFIKEGNTLRFRQIHSVCIRRGYCGYLDFKTNEHGNSINFLTEYMGYSFQEAVSSLTSASVLCQNRNEDRNGILPQPDTPPFTRLYDYLTRERCIPVEVIDSLVSDKLLYQEKIHGNIVFVNPERDYAEIRGTVTRRPFHQSYKTKTNRFWYFKNTIQKPYVAFITEAAIDAVSLYCLMKESGYDSPAVYISIGGVFNQKTIDRISSGICSIIAVDNDEAGRYCRERNSDLESIIPVNKDWNDDLKAKKELLPPT